jgi:serine/threonine protein kinase
MLCAIGQPPFDGKSSDELYQRICTGDFQFTSYLWESIPPEYRDSAKDLVSHLLMFDPSERFDTHEAVNHALFNFPDQHSKIYRTEDLLLTPHRFSPTLANFNVSLLPLI